MKTYIVGGAVRDMLMGVESKDIDYVVVGSTHDEMIAAGFKQVGADFPVYLSDDGTEYALARTERKNGKGYNGFITDHSPDITLEEDLGRRDLTINAIAMDADGTIIDPYNGVKDIEERNLRHVSDAFSDDPVRVLRLARFMARYGWGWKVANETLDLCLQMVKAGELNHLTKERVLKEMEKALGEPYPELFFQFLDVIGALRILIPSFSTITPVSQYVRKLIGSAKNVKLRYASLALAFNAEKFEDEYKVSIDWRRYRKMYRGSYGSRFTTDVERLYQMDAYRQKDLFLEMSDDIWRDEGETWDLYYSFLNTIDIGFADLTEEQQATLKGPQISEAIKAKRMEVANAN